MTIKDPLYKQIIVSMGDNNINKFMKTLCKYVANLNYSLKSIKSDTIIDFIYSNHQGLIVTTNKVMFPSDLSMVKKDIKNTNTVMATTSDKHQ